MKDVLKVEHIYTENNGIGILKDISFTVKENEILGIVGESGCGKSTLLRTITNMFSEHESATNGRVIFDEKDLLSISYEEMRKIRGKSMGIIFQNPASSLNPIRKLGKQFIETIRSSEKVSKKEAINRSLKMLSKVNLRDCECLLNSYPYELSGGMNQRVAISLAMVRKPKILIADEPTSALDVTVQAQVVKEMMKLREEFKTSIIIVTHSLGVVSHMADKIAVMYCGRIIEYGDKNSILTNPLHPYTKALISAVPKLDGSLPKGIPGNPPLFSESHQGCKFKERCNECSENCENHEEKLIQISENHYVSCIKAVEMEQKTNE